MATKNWIATTSQDWSIAANWSPSGVPVTGDDVYLMTAGTADVAAGLSQSAVTLASLNIGGAYTGKIGTASAYLQISATKLMLGQQTQAGTTGTGSSRIKIDLGSIASSVIVVGTASSTADAGLEPVRILGTNSANTLTVTNGRVGVATTTAGEMATFSTVNATGGNSIVNLGSGVTLTTVTNNGGTVTTGSAVTTLNTLAGTTTTRGTGLIGTLYAGGGTVNIHHRPTGTGITTLTLDGATVNTKGAPSNLTIGSTLIKEGGTLIVFSATQLNLGTVTIDPSYDTNLSVTLNS